MFWSSDKLTGSQTNELTEQNEPTFWSSDKLTGSQTEYWQVRTRYEFWSSDKLTGSQTVRRAAQPSMRFGAVTN